MVPGFVWLGLGALLLQLVVIASVYRSVARKNSIADGTDPRRARYALVGGALLVTLGQAAGLIAVGSLQAAPWLTLQEAIRVVNVGVPVAVVGYVGVGYALYRRGRVGET